MDSQNIKNDIADAATTPSNGQTPAALRDTGASIQVTPGSSTHAEAGAKAQSTDLYYWLLTAFLMAFVLIFLLLLRRARKVRRAAYPEILSGFAERYNYTRRRLLD